MMKYFAQLHDYDLAKIVESYLRQYTLSEEIVKKVQKFYITTPTVNKWLDDTLIAAMAIDEMNKEVLWRFKNTAFQNYFKGS